MYIGTDAKFCIVNLFLKLVKSNFSVFLHKQKSLASCVVTVQQIILIVSIAIPVLT